MPDHIDPATAAQFQRIMSQGHEAMQGHHPVATGMGIGGLAGVAASPFADKGPALGIPALGSLLGAALAPSGHRMEGFGRGLLRGAGTALGGIAGSGLGGAAAGGAIMGGQMTDPKSVAMTGLGGYLGGNVLGPFAGYGLSGHLLGKPSWEREDEEKRKKHPQAKEAAEQLLALL